MRLPSELVTIICKGIFRQLSQRRIITSENQKDTTSKMEKVIQNDLKLDEGFTIDAKTILEKRMTEIQASRDLDFRALLSKVKRELASKAGYVVWGGDGKFSSDKIRQLSREFSEFFQKDDLVEYFVKPDQLVREITMAFERESLKDRQREEKAAQKVRSIRRGITEGSAEFAALYDQFYREYLEKEA